MDIHNARVLILGGSGLVGMAIARQLLPYDPATLVISALTRTEAEEATATLRREHTGRGEIVPEWGDVFVPLALKDRRRSDVLADAAAREVLLDELYGDPTAEAVERSTMGDLLLRHRPTIVVDCINTATIFAYQNVFASAARLRASARSGEIDAETVERHLSTLYLPQLIRHAQTTLDGMRRAATQLYLKIGTSGTGGMGLNIPFTHSEERPSRMLLAKASIAGAHTLLLFLMARTPDAPAAKEIKPTAAISWKRIAYGEITRAGRPITRVDATGPVPIADAFATESSAEPAWRATGEPLRGVFVDAGENGLFSPAEFETLTALGLMEFITPEEIAQDAVREIRGFATGRDVVAALDASTSGPTYRAGVLRHSAIEYMDDLEREHGVESVAYEMLGPPRLSKLLFEAAILGRIAGGQIATAAELDAAEVACAAADLIRDDADLRTRILTTGLPILLPDGERLLRGAEIKVAPETGTAAEREQLVHDGWVDLRAANWTRWRDRIGAMRRGADAAAGPQAGSHRDIEPWERTQRLRPGVLAAWVFRYEDAGERIKR